MFVRELDRGVCPTCGATVGMGLKEEPTGWKAYRVCLAENNSCQTKRVGRVPRASVDHFDDVIDQAATMIETSIR